MRRLEGEERGKRSWVWCNFFRSFYLFNRCVWFDYLIIGILELIGFKFGLYFFLYLVGGR